MPGPSSAIAISARGCGGVPSSTRDTRHFDVTVFLAVLDRVVDQVLQHLDDLVAVSPDADRRLALGDHDLGVRCGGERIQRLGDVGRDVIQLDDATRAKVDAHLDAAQRQEIVDEARHAVRLARHDAEEALARLRIVARRALQRFDKATQRCERRAQLVTGVRDEVGAHLGELVLLRHVAQ